MTYNIQPDFNCNNCIKCGQRPVVEQIKKVFKIKCPNRDCNNVVSGNFLNFNLWNELNKPGAQIRKTAGNDAVKKTA